MKQNSHDTPIFFANYSHMARSLGGLDTVGVISRLIVLPSGKMDTLRYAVALVYGPTMESLCSRRGLPFLPLHYMNCVAYISQ